MQITVELPDALAERLNTYLKLIPKDSSELLALAGIVTDAPHNARDRPEDYEHGREH